MQHFPEGDTLGVVFSLLTTSNLLQRPSDGRWPSSLPLKYLNLQHCYQVTDIGLAHLSSLPLQYLNLEHCEQVTDAGYVQCR